MVSKDQLAKLVPSQFKSLLDTKYYTVQDPGDKGPYALLRVEGPDVSLWQPEDDDWLPAQWMFGYVYGDQTGAQPLEDSQVERVKKSGTIVQLPEDARKRLSSSKA